MKSSSGVKVAKVHISIAISIKERALKEISTSTSTVKVHQGCKKIMSQYNGNFMASLDTALDNSVRISGLGEFANSSFKTSLGLSWTRISEVSNSLTTEDYVIPKNKLYIQWGTSQIYAEKVTTVTIDGKTAEQHDEVHLGIRKIDNVDYDVDGQLDWILQYRQKAWSDIMHIKPPRMDIIQFDFSLHNSNPDPDPNNKTAHIRCFIKSKKFPGKCLHLKDGNCTNGNIVHLWDIQKKSWPMQEWIIDGKLIRSALYPGKCLHREHDDYNNGNRIHLWDIQPNSHPRQEWIIDGKRIKSGYGNMCLHKKYVDGRNGDPVHLWDSLAEAWIIEPL